MARSLFQSWFVDFDPVRAKLDGRPPANLDPTTAALFPDSFQDSPLGPIPKGWTVNELGEIADLDKGLSYKGDGLVDEGGMPIPRSLFALILRRIERLRLLTPAPP